MKRRITGGRVAGSILIAVGFWGTWTAWAGPNLVAIGYFDLPFKEAVGRDSMDGKSVIFEFDGEYDFGRVIVQADSPRSLIRRDFKVFYSGNGLVIDRNNAPLNNATIWMEFRLIGDVRPNRTYEYEFEGGGEQEIRGGIEAVLPALWLDGRPYGCALTLKTPPPTGDKIQRLRYIRGTMKTGSFAEETGASSIFLRVPDEAGKIFGVSRFTFREIDDEIVAGHEPEMPVPVRYIPIRSAVESQLGQILTSARDNFLQVQAQDGSWNAGDQETSIRVTSALVAALAEVRQILGDVDTSQTDDYINKIKDALPKALDWLSRQEPPENQFFSVETVARRLTCMARYGDREKYRKTLAGDTDFLAQAQYEDGGWSSVSFRAQQAQAVTINPDNTNSALAVLALREAAIAGQSCDRRVWALASNYWVEGQSHTGRSAGGYREKLEKYGGLAENVTPARTALAATALSAILEVSFGLDAKDCSQFTRNRPVVRALDEALGWLDKNYGLEFFGADLPQIGNVAAVDPYTKAWTLQQFTSVTGIHVLNNKRPFREEADELLKRFQGGLFDGSLYFTAEALQFLAMGSSPVVLQRLVVGDEASGVYEYSSDGQHMVRYLMDRRQRPLNWRRTTLDRPVRDWLEVPILFLNAAGPLKLDEESIGKLRTYCMNGGTIVANVARGFEAQRESLNSALRQAFPEYEPHAVAANHPVLTMVEKIGEPQKMTAIGNGLRDFVFLPDEDWSCAWHSYSRRDEKGQPLIGQNVEMPPAFRFINNLLDYVTDGSPLRSSFAESTYLPGSSPTRRITASALQVGGVAPAYPDLLKTLDNTMRTLYRTEVVDAGDNPAALLWVAVTGDRPFTAEQKTRILNHIKSGSYLLFDVATGNEAWAEAALAQIRQIDPALAFRRTSALHPIYTGKIAGTRGFELRSAPLRNALRSKFVEEGRNPFSTLTYQGKEIGVFSHYDLASGLCFTYLPGCRGLMPEAARETVVNAALLALRHKPVNP